MESDAARFAELRLPTLERLSQMQSEEKTKTILPGARRGRITVPSSKSIAHRELIAAILSGVAEPVIRGESKDTEATRRCLKAMMSGEQEWHCGESGSTLRFLTPIAGVMGWKGCFICEGRLAARPQMPFEKKSKYVIPGNVSSQFVSGLLMALPLADWNSEIVVEGKFESSAYVDLTESVLKEAGIVIEKPCAGHWIVRGGQRYAIAGGREVEGDWSQAAFFLAMGVDVDGLKADSQQGDRAVAQLLDAPVVDASPVPDLIPALAAHAAFRPGTTRFVNCGRLRIKESDRLATVTRQLNNLGADVTEGEDYLIIRGKERLTGGRCHGENDHRIAMMCALASIGCDGPVTLTDYACVKKSYPGFWNDFMGMDPTCPDTKEEF
jgi:3-phosphoshikimate 1-carboxyvinyltransferase